MCKTALGVHTCTLCVADAAASYISHVILTALVCVYTTCVMYMYVYITCTYFGTCIHNAMIGTKRSSVRSRNLIFMNC